jgi:hypothetical protein
MLLPRACGGLIVSVNHEAAQQQQPVARAQHVLHVCSHDGCPPSQLHVWRRWRWWWRRQHGGRCGRQHAPGRADAPRGARPCTRGCSRFTRRRCCCGRALTRPRPTPVVCAAARRAQPFIHWNALGNGFVIPDITSFENQVLPAYYKHK